jgi:preprotein translocase subunit SecB
MFAPAQLGDVWLAHVRFDDAPDFEVGQHPELQYDVVPYLTVEELEFEENGSAAATVRLDLEIRWFAGESEERAGAVPFEIALGLRAGFTWTEAPAEELARRWLDFMAMYLLWPYARAHVANITSFSAAPTLTLATLEVPELPELESEENVRSEAGELDQFDQFDPRFDH